MATIPEFEAPDFVKNQDVNTIMQKMMANLPDDIDDTEGGYPWDLTMPTALEKSELIQYHLPLTLQYMFPMWATGKWLDYHAQVHNLIRKAANKATGTLTVTGTVGAVIPAKFRFASPAVGGQPAVEYETDSESTIGTSGNVSMTVTAVEAGTSGNVTAGTVCIMSTPMTGIISITNPAAITGGTEIECDDDLRERLLEAIADTEASFVGSVADYKRWAETVPGVGKATVMPLWNGAGTVKVVVVDANGQPANSVIVNAVSDYILSPDNVMQRKAPIGATVSVVTPSGLTINYAFTVELADGVTIASVTAAFKASLINYYTKAKDENELKYNMIASILMNTAGVADFTGLTINNGTANITIAADEYPVTGTVTATEAT